MTGTCTCVGILGPALGGGFGRYMGFYGLATDQIISLDVVLADGSLTKVSATSNPDLYWGMRGAGHNFGIVTQFQYKIHDRPIADWYYTIMFFTADKLEKFFELLDTLSNLGKQPKEVVVYALFTMNPQISTTNVSIYSFLHCMNNCSHSLSLSSSSPSNMLVPPPLRSRTLLPL